MDSVAPSDVVIPRMSIIVYDGDTGRCLYSVHAPVRQAMIDFYHESSIKFVYFPGDTPPETIMQTSYVDTATGKLTDRPSIETPAEISITADGVETVRITVPQPCTARLDGVNSVITEGFIDIAADMPAEYVLEIEQWPYLDKTVRITAHAAV